MTKVSHAILPNKSNPHDTPTHTWHKVGEENGTRDLGKQTQILYEELYTCAYIYSFISK